MIISFSNTPILLACILGVLILASHCVGAFLRGRVARFASYIGVALHPLLLICLFLGGSKMDIAVASLMASVLVYSALNYASYLMRSKEADR